METAHVLLCPYCGQPTTVFVDTWAGNQDLTEDCTVCCSAMFVHIKVDDYEVADVRAEMEGR
jgi:hypothetical protein